MELVRCLNAKESVDIITVEFRISSYDGGAASWGNLLDESMCSIWFDQIKTRRGEIFGIRP